MNKRKVCVVTGTRADYGLLYWLMKEIDGDNGMELQLIVTGMHLNSEFGHTYKVIEKEFKIDEKVEMPLSSDSEIDISKSMGLAQIAFSKAYHELKPDIVLVLGDRFEIFSAVTAAMISRLPIAHLHGGEATEGVIDEAIRHSVTKMSHLHFVGHDDYKKRVIQLGEEPDRVFNFGAVGIDNIKKLKLLSKNEFQKSINFSLNKKNIIVTFHPVTLEDSTSKVQFNELLHSIKKLKDTNVIFTKSNSDHDGRIINIMIDDYVSNNSNCIAFDSLGQLRYLSALKYVDAIVGNSSSGLLEAPSFKIGTINIGDRQKGRIKAVSILDCNSRTESINEAFDTLYSKDFQNLLSRVENPFGDGGASKKIKQIIKKFDLSNILKKSFYNINILKL
jgi:GDP/UDP-N,N'-diacetylbacillosamine 2-epimerase (hydrolysing)